MRFGKIAGPLSTVLLWLGILLLLGGGGYWLVVRDFDMTARLILAAGILGVAGWVALKPEGQPRGRGGTRTLLHGSNAVVMSVAVVAILGFINYFGNANPQRWDLTVNQQNTLAPETVDVLKQLKQPVKITGFFQTEDNQRRQTAQDLLKLYQAQQPLITFEFVDPDFNPAAAQAAGIRIYGTLLFESGGKTQTTTSSTEQDITSTLLRLVSTRTPRVLFLTGHGEKSLDSTDRDSYSQTRTVLQGDNYEVGSLNLTTVVTPTADLANQIDLLVIAGPQRDLLPEEATAINGYVDNGGRLMLLLDPLQKPLDTMSQLMRRYYVEQRPGWVIDPAGALRQDAAAFATQRYENSPVTDKMTGLLTVYPGISALQVQTSTPGLRLTRVLQTSDRAWLDDDPRAPAQTDTKPKGPFPLGYLSEKVSAEQPAPGGENAPKGRAVILGDSDFATNQWLGTTALGNRDMIANLVNWATQSDELITIRPKPFQSRQLFLANTQQNFLFFSSVLFLPLAVLLLGGVVWWRRR